MSESICVEHLTKRFENVETVTGISSLFFLVPVRMDRSGAK
jgi:hypothetical protein